MSEPKTYTLEAPGAVLHYDVRDNGEAGHPVLLLIGSPMGASGFAALAEQFADRTVVTYDPRGTERSQRTDGEPPGSAPDRARRGPAPADPGAGRRAGRRLRQQRRRGQRAGPGGQASPADPHPGGARAARRPGTAGP